MAKNIYITAENIMCPWCEYEDIYEVWTNKRTDSIIQCTHCEKQFVVYLDVRVCFDEEDTIDIEKKNKRKKWLLE